MSGKKTAEQGELFDVSLYDQSELVGSHSDDFEDKQTISRYGKKSKYCPTWDYTEEDRKQAARVFAATLNEIVARVKPAVN